MRCARSTRGSRFNAAKHVGDVALLGHREHFAIHVERLDRPTLDAAQIVLVRELRQNAIHGRRGPVAALQIALIRRARETGGERRGLTHRHENLALGRGRRSVQRAVPCARSLDAAHAASSAARTTPKREPHRRHLRQRAAREPHARVGGQRAEQLREPRVVGCAVARRARCSGRARWGRRRSRRRCRRAALASRPPWCPPRTRCRAAPRRRSRGVANVE